MCCQEQVGKIKVIPTGNPSFILGQTWAFEQLFLARERLFAMKKLKPPFKNFALYVD